MPVAGVEAEAEVVAEEAEDVMLEWALLPAPPPRAPPAPPGCVWVVASVCVCDFVRVRVTVTVLVYVVPGTKAPPPAPLLSLPPEPPPDGAGAGAPVGLGLHWPASARRDSGGETMRSATDSRAEREVRIGAWVLAMAVFGEQGDSQLYIAIRVLVQPDGGAFV